MHSHPQSTQRQQPSIRSLIEEVRLNLPTREAATHVNVKAQTLRKWACTGTGPIKPIRVGGRLAWPVEELRKLLGKSA